MPTVLLKSFEGSAQRPILPTCSSRRKGQQFHQKCPATVLSRSWDPLVAT